MKKQLIKITILGIIFCCFTSLFSQSNLERIESSYDLYSAGKIGTGNFHEDTACYWKNNVRHNLSPSKSRVSALFIDGKDVYISGHYLKNRKVQPCYWKNGNLIDLEENGETYTNDIFVAGNDVYIIGNQRLNTSGSVPCYWKNGERKDLEVLEKMSGYAKAITSNGKDFIIVGFIASSTKEKENKIEACYWKNGDLIQLNSSPFDYSIASKVIVDKGTIYIAGRLDDTEKECLSIWQDSTRTDYLTIPNKYSSKSWMFTWESADYVSFSYEKGITPHKIAINSIRIINDDIYIVGKQDKIACYWLNGEVIELTNEVENIFPVEITLIDQKLLIAGTNNKSICIWENGVKKEIVKLDKNESTSEYGFMKK